MPTDREVVASLTEREKQIVRDTIRGAAKQSLRTGENWQVLAIRRLRMLGLTSRQAVRVVNLADRRFSGRDRSAGHTRSRGRRDAQQPSWIVVDTERGNRVVGYHRGRVDAREDARERNLAAQHSRYAYKPEYALEGV